MSRRWITLLLSFGLVANLLPVMTFPATMPSVISAFGLTEQEAGWIGGIYFAGYAFAVPFLSTLTDRVDPRRIYLTFCALGALSSFVFPAWADSFGSALVIRFFGGVALAGVHMPGLKLLTDFFEEGRGGRATGVYASSYAFGSAGSFLVAGVVDAALGWQATFFAAAVGPILAAMAIGLLPRPAAKPSFDTPAFQLKPLLRNRALVSYVVAFAGNTWEVFAIRVWFVAYLSWVLDQPGNAMELPPLAVISGLAAIAGVPVSIAVGELAFRFRRERVIALTSWVSVAVCLALAGTTDAEPGLVLVLLVLLQISSFADVGALTTGAVDAAEPKRRGASLALYSFAGFVTGWLGPVTVGTTLGWFDSTESGWAVAFVVLALGSTVTALAMQWGGGKSSRT
jgi:MFS family permease